MARDWERDKAICAAATPGPWHVRKHPGYHDLLCDVYCDRSPDTLATTAFFGWRDTEMEANAAFIAEAREGWPAALEEIDRLRVQVAALEAELARRDGRH